jgi:branched-chain amino acid transport system substrate-binding protein
MQRRWIATGGLVLALLTTACSVPTPRHEAATGSTGAGQPGFTATAAGGVTSVDPVTGLPVDTAAGGPAAAIDPVTGAPLPAGGAPVTGGAGPGAAAAGGPVDASGAPVPQSTAPGVSEDAIVVSVVAGFSGVLAPVVEQAYDGLETWQADINANGGIHGRQVVLKRVDHKETADGGIAACKEVTSNGSFVAMVPEGIEANLTAITCLDAAGIPSLYFAATIDPSWELAFSDVVTSGQGGAILASYVAGPLQAGDRGVGVIYVNQLAYKEAADTFAARGQELGLAVVGMEPVEPNQGSFTPQLLRLREAGAEILVISATAEAVGILRDARALGWRPQIAGWGYTFDFITAAGRDLFRDVTGLRTSAAVDSPAYGPYAERMAANGHARSRDLDTEAFLAYGHGALLGELLQRAGPQPTRASFVTGAEGIQGYDNGILPPITYGPGDHVGADAAFPVTCCNSDWTWRSDGPARSSF